MKLNQFLIAGVGVGVAALALRKRRSTHCRSGEERFNEHDATLYGLKAHQDSLTPETSHIREGLGRPVPANRASA